MSRFSELLTDRLARLRAHSIERALQTEKSHFLNLIGEADDFILAAGLSKISDVLSDLVTGKDDNGNEFDPFSIKSRNIVTKAISNISQSLDTQHVQDFTVEIVDQLEHAARHLQNALEILDKVMIDGPSPSGFVSLVAGSEAVVGRAKELASGR